MADSIKPQAQTLHAEIEINPSSPLPVYRVRNGELVRVPNDERDPKRRYSHVADGERSYLREFTDEEERARDREEAQWEADRPKREAEAAEQAEEERKFRESLKYEHRVVAFLDILGWAQAIIQSSTSPELTQRLGIAVQTLAVHVRMNEWQRQHGGPGGWAGDPMVTHFSDSILISFSADRYAQHMMESTLSAIVHNLMIQGFVVRGGVSQGLMIHRPGMAYGPALVAAYELESRQASVPRIVLDQSLAAAWGGGTPIMNREQALLGHWRQWRQDDDSLYFLDHLSNPYGLSRMSSEPMPVGFSILMGKWRELIAACLTRHKNQLDVFRKYVWLARYFNKVCIENPGAKLDSISLPGDSQHC